MAGRWCPGRRKPGALVFPEVVEPQGPTNQVPTKTPVPRLSEAERAGQSSTSGANLLERIRRMPVRLILREVTHHGVLGRAREWTDEVCFCRANDVDVSRGRGSQSYMSRRVALFVALVSLAAAL